MARASKGKWADIPAGQDNPLSFAVTSRDRSTLDMVREAIDHKQVRLAYQPVVDARRQASVAFYEGLIRVLDETGRIIPAGQFINAIETTEAGRLMDCLALEYGLKTLATRPEIRMSVNMSARSIGYGRWQNTLKRGLKRGRTVGERLILEITETSAMMMPELVTQFMEEVQADGVAFALDNFGAGFTSFSFLKDFYFDILKVDGQFIRNIRSDQDNQVLADAMVRMGRGFDMFTVAQNVETPEDAAFLASLGFDCLQGYLFGAPSISPPWKNPEAVA